MSNKVTAFVTFKAKTSKIIDSDGITRPVIDFKAKVSRKDCNLKPHQHDYFNSDLFPGMLQHAYDEAIRSRRWSFLDQLPAAVSVDTSKFLATVTVKVSV